MFLAKRYAEMSNVDVASVFTETGHGKGPMDGVGAEIKNSIDNAVIAAELLQLSHSKCHSKCVSPLRC